MANNIDTCRDYKCEFPGEGEHLHIGIQPYLRQVLDIKGKLIDGKTGETPVEEKENVG